MIIFFHCKPIIAIVLTMVLLLGNVEEIRGEELKEGEVLAKGCAVMDGYNGRLLFDKNADTPMANASTTKILTSILTLESCDLEEEVLISKYASAQPKVRLGLISGESYKLKDLMYGLMLESFNDCAVAIAEHVSGSVERFADLMNQKVRELGCSNTYFITPNGLDAEDTVGEHHTTPEDLCRIMKYCVWESQASSLFTKLCQTLNYHCVTPDGQDHIFVNHNHLFENDENAIAGKTGYTAKAGYCYVTAYEEKGLRFCIALLGCGWPNHKDYKWIDSRKLIQMVKDNYKVVDAADQREDKNGGKEKVFSPVVEGGYLGAPNLNQWQKEICLEENMYGPEQVEGVNCLIRDSEAIVREEKLNMSQAAPVGKDVCIGREIYQIQGQQIGERKLLMKEEIKAWNLKDLWEAILWYFF